MNEEKQKISEKDEKMSEEEKIQGERGNDERRGNEKMSEGEKIQEEVERIDRVKSQKIFFLLFLGIVFFICLINLAEADGNYSTVNGVYSNFTWNDTFTNDNFTLSAWINLKGSGERPIIYKPFSYSFLVNSSNHLEFRFNNGTNFSSSGTVDLNTWVFVAVSYNGSSINFYIDNTNKTFVSYSSGYYKSSNTFEAIIGKDAFNYFNGTIDEIRIFDEALSEEEINLLYYSNLKKVGVGEWLFYKIQTGLEVGLNYFYSLFVVDFAGNTNSTETRFISGNSKPIIQAINQTPLITEYDNIDPNSTITMNVSVYDVDNNLNKSLLQVWNSSGILIFNETMTNASVYNTTTNFSLEFTTNMTEQNYTYSITTIDNQGESNSSDNYTLQSFWDCSWDVSPSSLEETIGFFEDELIGNVTINNTGDSEYSNNNCSIEFTISYGGLSSSYTSLISDSSNWLTNNRGFQYTTPVTVNASNSSVVNINFSFPTTDSAFTENPYLRFSSSINNSITGDSYLDTTTELIVSPPQPLLYQNIEDYPSTYVYLTPGAFNLSAYVRNLAGDDTESNTAYNVSFNWTLPSSLSSRVSSGNISSTYANLTNSTKQYSNLTINLSTNLESMERGTLNVSIYSFGYDNESDLIINSNSQTILNESVNITFLCYSESDNICVASCGIGVDPDCVALSSSSSSSGGGGGGGGSPTTESVKTSADFQLVRSEENKVPILFENKDSNQSLKDLTFTVKGDISRYVEIVPEYVASLGPGQKINITLLIVSPSYIDLGTQELIITMNAKKGSSGYTDAKKITLEIHELSLSKAEELLKESEELMNEFRNANLSDEDLEDLLNETETAFEDFDLEKVRDNHEEIKTKVGFALDSKRMISELENLISVAEEKGIKVSESKKLWKLAKLSMGRNEFEQAYKRIKEAQLVHALEVKGELGNFGYYVKEYPVELSLGALFFFVFSFGAYNLNRLRAIKRRLRYLKKEEKIINELIRVIQKEVFKEKKMSMGEYVTAMKEYNKRLSKIIEEIITLETERVHMLKFKSKTTRLKNEKKKIIDLVKELQGDYMKHKKVETRTYELKMESFNKRLSEIEEKLATLEANKAIKKIKGVKI